MIRGLASSLFASTLLCFAPTLFVLSNTYTFLLREATERQSRVAAWTARRSYKLVRSRVGGPGRALGLRHLLRDEAGLLLPCLGCVHRDEEQGAEDGHAQEEVERKRLRGGTSVIVAGSLRLWISARTWLP